MSKRSDDLLLIDILDGAEKILRYTKDMSYNDFIDDEMVVDAVARNFEIIGEAANRIDPSFKERISDIEWIRLTGLRNRIIHEYFGVDREILWTIIEENLGDLIFKLKNRIHNSES